MPTPTFENFWNGTLVQIPRNSVDQVKERLNERLKSLQLSDNERNVFEFIKMHDQLNERLNEQVNTLYIANKTGLSYITIRRILVVLQEQKLIQRIGSKKTGYWTTIF